MSVLHIRSALRAYVRDSYLGNTPALNPAFTLIDCSIGSSQWGVSERARKVVISADQNIEYPEPFYDRLLKPVILKRFGLAERAANILFFGHGTFNLAERLIHKFIESGTMLGVGPQFNEIPSEFVAGGGRYEPIGITPPDYAFPFSALNESIRAGVTAVYLDNPNNPLGRAISMETIGRIAEKASQYGAILIVDEAYGDFVADSNSAIHLVSHHDNIVVLRSLSKCLGLAAARVGYMFLSDDLAEAYRQIDVPFEPALPSALLARETLLDEDFLESVRAKSWATKRRLMPIFAASGLSVLPTHPTTSILTLHRHEGDAVSMLSGIGVSVEPGSAFRQTHADWDDSFCRFRLPPERYVDELVRRLAQLNHERNARC